jgi:hypothetical protein
VAVDVELEITIEDPAKEEDAFFSFLEGGRVSAVVDREDII